MPSPWLFALKMIPWASLLSNGPAVAKAAEAVLSATRERKAHAGVAVDEIRGLSDRLAALERHDRADAELGKQIGDQIAALTKATEVLAARQRWLAITATALWLGLLAVVLWRL